ncbi:hypothetical protein ACE01N_20155, partial [Saccharicrinis sp. FJH2]|uniref:hypothetical protein n=1 Tax=Saccharicrinis sp. FJH65 TaxID=3344659 RepID=UPI0035F38E2B
FRLTRSKSEKIFFKKMSHKRRKKFRTEIVRSVQCEIKLPFFALGPNGGGMKRKGFIAIHYLTAK